MQYHFVELVPPSVGSCSRCGTRRKSSCVAIEILGANMGKARLICPDCAPENLNVTIEL